MKKIFSIPLIVAVLLMVFSVSCEEKKHKKHKNKDKEEQQDPLSDESSSKEKSSDGGSQNNNTGVIDCDTSLWKYVYNRDRLEVQQMCKTVTGTIEESSANEDGDQHMLLKLDSGQDDILTKKNTKKKDGNLVIEAVCANKTSLSKVGNTCNGYINHIQIPKLGAHVKVTGSLVIDSHNGWAEIHPITKIEVLK